MQQTDLLIISRINKDIELLPYAWRSIQRNAVFNPNFKFHWYVVMNLNTLEFIPSETIKFLAGKAYINYSTCDWNSVLNESLIDATNLAVYKYVYILEEQNCLPEGFFNNISSVKEEKDLLVFQQMREDGKVYGGDWNPTSKKAAGILDFGQIVFNTISLLRSKGFDESFAASGKTVEKILNSGYEKVIKFNDKVLTTRRGLQIPSTASKPKVMVNPGSNFLSSQILEAMVINEATADMNNRYGIIRQFTESDNDQYNKMMEFCIIAPNARPIISLFTSAYNIGDRILQTWETVKNQTFKSWEWVIVNDSCDGGRTWKVLQQIKKEDTENRVHIYQFTERTKGCIGEAKYRAAGLCSGHLLAELDHDDLLHPDCLQDIYDAADANPSCGFFYSDCVEVDKQYNCPKYPEGFALGYGSYRTEDFIGITWEPQNTVPTNPLTIRHIVGVPNHIRCWRKEVYHSLGGYNYYMRIADDYELIVRTFLVTKFCHIKKCLYFQRFDGNNSQDNGNRSDIQLKVREIAKYYRKRIAERFKELGIEDFVDENLDNVSFLWGIPPRGSEYNVNETYIPE